MNSGVHVETYAIRHPRPRVPRRSPARPRTVVVADESDDCQNHRDTPRKDVVVHVLQVDAAFIHAQHGDGVDVECNTPDPEKRSHLRELSKASLNKAHRVSFAGIGVVVIHTAQDVSDACQEVRDRKVPTTRRPSETDINRA